MPRGFLPLPEAVRQVAESLPMPRSTVIDTPIGKIGLRDPDELQLPRDPLLSDAAYQAELQRARAALRAERATSVVRTALRRAFADEALPAFWFLPTGDTLAIPPAAWRGTVLLDVWDGEPLAWQPTDQSAPKLWGWVMVREIDLRGWLAGGREPARKVLAPAGPNSADAAGRTISDAKLRSWYRQRVADWSKGAPAPSAKADLEAARLAFPNNRITRDHMRGVRRDKAPKAWTEPGCKKSRGKP